MLSTHIMQEVEAICSRVIIVTQGRLVADGTISQLKAGQFVQEQTVLVEFNQAPDQEKLRKIDGMSSLEAINPTTFIAGSQKN